MSDTQPIEAKLVNSAKDKEREFESVEDAEDQRQDLIGLGADPEDLEVVEVNENGTQSQEDTIEQTEQEPRPTEPVDPEVQQRPTQSDTGVVEAEPVEPEEPIEKLSHDPITFLKSVNDEFVNYIHGEPAISKKGFRFIQREFEISTESDVVEVVDDPLGCIVWAKAELPDGYSAEAHGEGWQFESDVDDNEFVRYADSRAKNRAISDLTSAGALAVSELQGDSDAG